MELIGHIGTIAGFALPFFNIPLIIKIIRRKSSADISMTWVAGVWICIFLMTPRAIQSQDIAFRLFGITNIIFFSLVSFFAVKYRKGK